MPARIPWIIHPPADHSKRTVKAKIILAQLCPLILILGILLLPVKAYAEAKDPFSAVVRVNREIGGHCTGFAIDARAILTAAHCLWLERPRNWIRPTSLHVLAGYDRGQYRQHLRVVEYRVPAGYAPKLGNPDRAADWAVLVLDQAFSGAPAPLAVKPPRLNASFIIAGFANSRLHRLTRHVNCKLQRIGQRAFQHSCATAKGVSGAPILGWEGGARATYGLHVASSRVAGIAVTSASILKEFQTARRPY